MNGIESEYIYFLITTELIKLSTMYSGLYYTILNVLWQSKGHVNVKYGHGENDKCKLKIDRTILEPQHLIRHPYMDRDRSKGCRVQMRGFVMISPDIIDLVKMTRCWSQRVVSDTLTLFRLSCLI